MKKFMCLMIVFGGILFILNPTTYAAGPYTFSVEKFSAEQFGVSSPVYYLDDFNDNQLEPWLVYEGTVYESDGLLTLTDPGYIETWQSNNYIAHRENSRVVIGNQEHVGIENGGGDFTVTSRWTFGANIPDQNQLYNMESDIEETPFGEDIETITFGVVNIDPTLAEALAEFLEIFDLDPDVGLYIVFQRWSQDANGAPLLINQTFHFDEEDVTDDIILSLEFDDTTKQFNGAFSLDGGLTFQRPFEPIDTYIDQGCFSKWEFTAESWEVSIPVVIDIKPGSFPNCFNNDGNGVIPVAILSSNDFDASQVDPSTCALDGQDVRIVGRGKIQAHIEDVNGDGIYDLMVQIEDVDGTYIEGETLATLTGQTFDGIDIQGTDYICIVP